MGLYKHYGVEFLDHYHIMKISKLHEDFITQHCIGQREQKAPPPPLPTTHTQPQLEAMSYYSMDPDMRAYFSYGCSKKY